MKTIVYNPLKWHRISTLVDGAETNILLVTELKNHFLLMPDSFILIGNHTPSLPIAMTFYVNNYFDSPTGTRNYTCKEDGKIIHALLINILQ